MKTYDKTKLILLSILLTFSGSILAANSQSAGNTELLKIRDLAVQQISNGQNLNEILKQITDRSGITFKINADISNIKVKPNLVSNDWNSTIRSVLVGYNWVAVEENHVLKNVIITGKNTESNAQITQHVAVNDVEIVEALTEGIDVHPGMGYTYNPAGYYQVMSEISQ